MKDSTKKIPILWMIVPPVLVAIEFDAIRIECGSLLRCGVHDGPAVLLVSVFLVTLSFGALGTAIALWISIRRITRLEKQRTSLNMAFVTIGAISLPAMLTLFFWFLFQ
ncbi:MAG TPA: hypothetical protein VHB46_01480 [Burkholderiales bacterium]|nr:hypothetical protein [Burkholderiales bacterium]